MTEPRYTIHQKPSGKWALYAKGVFIAEFTTLADAQGGMERCIKRVEFKYDAHGNAIDE